MDFDFCNIKEVFYCYFSLKNQRAYFSEGFKVILKVEKFAQKEKSRGIVWFSVQLGVPKPSYNTRG